MERIGSLLLNAIIKVSDEHVTQMQTHFLFLFLCADTRLDLQSEMSVCVFLRVSMLITAMSNNSCDPPLPPPCLLPPAAHISRVCKQDVDPCNSQLF